MKLVSVSALAFAFAFACLGSLSAEASSLYQTGEIMGGVHDYREVLPGILYRGGAYNKRSPLNHGQLQALCEEGMGTAIYLYKTGFAGPSKTTCAKGSMSYQSSSYSGTGLNSIHQQIYDSIKSNHEPIFVHCWYGIHATGLVAATSLMQFCNMPTEKAVQYWKVGIAPQLQYQTVIDSIRSFRPDPKFELTAQERNQFCPQM